MALVVEPPPATLYEMETLWSEPTSMSLDENEMEDVPQHRRPSGNAEGKRGSGDLVREFQQAVEGLLHSHAEEMRAVIVAAVSAERSFWASDGTGVPRIRQTVSQDGGPVMKMQDVHGDQEVSHAKPHHWKRARKSVAVSEDSDEDVDDQLMKMAMRPRRLSLSGSSFVPVSDMLRDAGSHSRNSRTEKDASSSRPMKRVSPPRLPSETLPGQLPDEDFEARHADSNGFDTDSQSVRGSFRASDHDDEHHAGVMRGYAATKCGLDPDAMRRPATRRSTIGVMSISQMHVRALVKNVKFEYGVCMMVMLHAFVLGLQTDLVALGRVTTTPVPLLALEAIMCGIFTIELLLRIFAYRSRIFTMSGWQWNIFDSIIVGVQVSEQIITFVTRDDRALMNFSVARVIRSLRLIRLLRVARVLRGIGELRILVLSIMSALKSLAWTVVLLTLMIYTLAIYLTQMVLDRQATLEPDSKWTEALKQYYGSVPSAMLSLFMSLTGGLDWVVVCQPLMETISPVVGLLFSCYVAFGTFALLNVVTGVFVSSVQKSLTADRDMFMVSNARELFMGLDGGLRSSMTWEIFESKLDLPQMQAFLSAVDVDPSEAHGLFRLLDLDGSGAISVDEFLNGALRLRGNAKALDLALLLQEVQIVSIKVNALSNLS